jgi:hypothetical protein
MKYAKEKKMKFFLISVAKDLFFFKTLKFVKINKE